MKKLLCVLLSIVMTCSIGFSQTTILDFEADETSTVFQYFGSTLEEETTNVIANPDPSGINTSAMVSDFVKPADSESWAGAFATTDLVPISLTAGEQICVKVWSPASGNLGLKLESGNQADWITTQEINVTNQWTELCFDTSNPSVEDPRTPAAGGVYNQLVLFFDFGTVLSQEQTYYFDDVVVSGGSTGPASVTFSVDMNGYGGSFTDVYVSGTFNNWADDQQLLSDDDGDGVFTGTVADVELGSHEYLFQVDKFTDAEDLDPSASCTVTDDTGEFTNRSLVVASDVTLDPVCWNSCFACEESVKITFNVAKGVLGEVSPEGMYVAGGIGFGFPGDNRLTDDDGDGIYSITIEREKGFESYYTFTNGACGDFSCKESIVGQDCANPDHFNDRAIGPVDSDITVNTCFGLCSENTDCETDAFIDFQFSVDMTGYSGSFTTVFVSGNFNNWSADALPLTFDDTKNLWTGNANLLPGDYEFKYQVDGWTDEENFMEGDPCTATDETGMFTNRTLTVSEQETSVCYQWNLCSTCNTVSIDDLVKVNNLFSIQPNIVETDLRIIYGDSFSGKAKIIIQSNIGELLVNKTVTNSGVEHIDISSFEGGLYYITVLNEDKRQTHKFIKE